MPISRRYGVIFLHNPKAAGTSVEAALEISSSSDSLFSTSYSPEHIYAMQHLPYAELQRVVSAEDWHSLPKFTVVRNPWDRLVSDWNWRRNGRLPLGDLSFKDFLATVKEITADSDWVHRTDRRRFQAEYLGHFIPQHLYAGPEGSGVRVLRFERLDRQWKALCDEVLQASVPPLPVANKSDREDSHYSNMFEDKAMVQVVQEIYAEDIRRFKYSFEKPGKPKGFKSMLSGLKKRKGSVSPMTTRVKGGVTEKIRSTPKAAAAAAAAEPAQKLSRPDHPTGASAADGRDEKEDGTVHGADVVTSVRDRDTDDAACQRKRPRSCSPR